MPHLSHHIRFHDTTFTPGEVSLGQLVSLSSSSPLARSFLFILCSSDGSPRVQPAHRERRRSAPELPAATHVIWHFLRDLSLSPMF